MSSNDVVPPKAGRYDLIRVVVGLDKDRQIMYTNHESKTLFTWCTHPNAQMDIEDKWEHFFSFWGFRKFIAGTTPLHFYHSADGKRTLVNPDQRLMQRKENNGTGPDGTFKHFELKTGDTEERPDTVPPYSRDFFWHFTVWVWESRSPGTQRIALGWSLIPYRCLFNHPLYSSDTWDTQSDLLMNQQGFTHQGFFYVYPHGPATNPVFAKATLALQPTPSDDTAELLLTVEKEGEPKERKGRKLPVTISIDIFLNEAQTEDTWTLGNVRKFAGIQANVGIPFVNLYNIHGYEIPDYFDDSRVETKVSLKHQPGQRPPGVFSYTKSRCAQFSVTRGQPTNSVEPPPGLGN